MKGCVQLHHETPEGEAQVCAPDGYGPPGGDHGLHRLLHRDPGRQPTQPAQAYPGTVHVMGVYVNYYYSILGTKNHKLIS